MTWRHRDKKKRGRGALVRNEIGHLFEQQWTKKQNNWFALRREKRVSKDIERLLRSMEEAAGGSSYHTLCGELEVNKFLEASLFFF